MRPSATNTWSTCKMYKLRRNYILTVEDESGQKITIRPPFTVQFDITRNTLTSANVCQLRIFNLGEVSRNFVRFNTYDYRKYKLVEFRAGYGDDLPRIFRGNISQAWSVREGVDFITQIECFDGGFAFNNGVTSKEYAAGTTKKEIITDLAASLPDTTLGAVGDYPGVLTRGNSFNGNTAQILAEESGGGFFIDDGKANVLGNNEYIEIGANPIIINSQSGLLGTPALQETIAVVEMIFEPTLNVGHRVILDSLTGGNFNGDYKVTAVKHRGVISEAVAGSVVTTAEFFYTKALVGVPT